MSGNNREPISSVRDSVCRGLGEVGMFQGESFLPRPVRPVPSERSPCRRPLPWRCLDREDNNIHVSAYTALIIRKIITHHCYPPIPLKYNAPTGFS